MTDGPTLLADLGTLDKAGWDASWGANNGEEIQAAYQRLVAALDRLAQLEAERPALWEIAQAVAVLDPIVAWGSEWREVCGCCEGHQPEPDYSTDEPLPPDDAPIEHTAKCPIILARALLSASGSPAQGDQDDGH